MGSRGELQYVPDGYKIQGSYSVDEANRNSAFHETLMWLRTKPPILDTQRKAEKLTPKDKYNGSDDRFSSRLS